MGRVSRRSARAATLAPGSPPPEEGVRPSDGAWEAAALVDGELVRTLQAPALLHDCGTNAASSLQRLLGRYATEAEAWEAHDKATALHSGAASPRAPSGAPPARKAKASPARKARALCAAAL